MRQAGVLAAAGIVALEEMVERLPEDHRNADRLAAGLGRVPGITVEGGGARTNMVFFTLDEALLGRWGPFMAARGVLVGDHPGAIRAVTHYGIDTADIDAVVAAALDAAAACRARSPRPRPAEV